MSQHYTRATRGPDGRRSKRAKVAYATAADAQPELDAMSELYPDAEFAAYPCGVCSHFHIGRLPRRAA